MNLPPISPAKSPVSFAEVDAPTLFKRGEPIHTPDPPHTFKHFDSEVQTVQPKYMTGYCGFQPHQDQEAPLPRVIAAPVVGYTGCYRGKNIGKLGRCEVHRTRLSTWEKDTVSGILGVPAAHDDWEYSHYTNICENFSDKKFQESSSPALGSSTGYSSGFLSSVGTNPGTGSASSSGGFANHEAASTSGSLAYSQSYASRPEHEETETDRILQHIQQCLEGRFKTATAARSALKGAFFALDRFHCGRVQRGEFFEVLNKLAGAALSEGHMMYLTCALSCAGRHSPQLEGLSQLDSQSQSLGDDLDYVNYGRFLNIIVPRSKGKNALS